MNTKQTEALKLALEALEYIEHNYMSLPAPATKAITAIREALAEQPAQQHVEHCLWARNGHTPCPHVQPAQQQEPVAWHTVHKAVTATIEKCKAASGMHRAIDLVVNAAQITHDTLGTDTTPPAAPVQEPSCKETGHCVMTGLACFGPPAAPVQEPVALHAIRLAYDSDKQPGELQEAFVNGWNGALDTLSKRGPLYTSPPASKPLTDDPLQGAVDWLLEADGEYFCTATVQRTLRIGYNRAKRLCDTAKERAAHGIKEKNNG